MGDISENFSRWETACKCGCGFNTIDYELVLVLEDIRSHFGKPVTPTSVCRCKIHNTNIGGADSSQHIIGKAADIVVEGVNSDKVYEYLNNKYWNKYGIGQYDGRTHIDVRPEKTRWDKRST